MFMFKPCRKTASGEVLVDTYSGTVSKRPVCKLSKDPDVRHIVYIRSLRTYPLYNLKCTGSVNPNPKNIYFASPDPNDTDHSWKRKIDRLDQNGHQTFLHVRILSTKISFGDEPVITTVEVKSPISDSLTVTFNVTN
jgi:hypothetical protein